MSKAQSIEQAMGELESILEQLESRQLPLDSAFELFEKGMQLSAFVRGLLEGYEKRVRVLVDAEGSGGKGAFAPFEPKQQPSASGQDDADDGQRK